MSVSSINLRDEESRIKEVYSQRHAGEYLFALRSRASF